MVSSIIEKALNQQIKIEAESSQIYLAMASWAEKQGFEGVASFMYAHSDEERMHMLKMVKFINERGGHAQISELAKPPVSFGSFKDERNLTIASAPIIPRPRAKLSPIACIAMVATIEAKISA